MGEVYSEFLDELLSNIRARAISWEAQQRSGVIDESEVKTVKTIDKQRREKRVDLVKKVIKSRLVITVGWPEICFVDGEFGQEWEESGYTTVHFGYVD